jgi:FkbM family methyltransferase
MSLRETLSPLPFYWRAWRYRLRVEPREIAYVLATLRSGDCAIDIGAHRGGYLHWMRARVGPAGRVIAFEPQPELAAYLRGMAARLRMQQVTIEEMAVSDESGEAVLQVPEGGPACGATLEEGLVRGRKGERKVATCTLDGYLAQRPALRPRLIKCDVEGHELRAFRGAERTLRELRPRLIFECEARHHPRDSMQSVFDYLIGLGYCGHYYHSENVYPIREFTPELQRDPKSRKSYVNNFIFHPREEACPC